MRLHTLLIVSHIAAAAVGGLCACLLQVVGSMSVQALIVLLSAGVVAATALFISHRFRQGMRIMLQAVAKGRRAEELRTGIQDIDQTAQQLAEYSQRWAEAATRAREQTRDVEELLFQLDRRASRLDGNSPNAGLQLRRLMAGIADAVDGDLNQMVSGAQELSRSVEQIAEGAEDQSDALSKTTTYVEQLSADIDTVARDSDGARQSVSSIRDVAAETIGRVEEVTAGMERLRHRLEKNERRLRTLGDHSREIGSIVENIGAIASRTDLLALNASIESVRAGEHGRGFAIVADEVHRLAEQSAQATREVATLLESAQLETQESIHVVVEEQSAIDSEMQAVRAAKDGIERMLGVLNSSSDHVGEITAAAEHQLMMARDIVIAVERIANVAKSTRSLAERARWSAKSLSKVTASFDTALTPLRHTAGRPTTGLPPTQEPVEDVAPAAAVEVEEEPLAV